MCLVGADLICESIGMHVICKKGHEFCYHLGVKDEAPGALLE